MVDMQKIYIWQGCDPAIDVAVSHFQKLWGPYSLASRRYHIMNLIREIIDPAVEEFLARLPSRYSGIPLPMHNNNLPFSECIKLKGGFHPMLKFQRYGLRRLINFTNDIDTFDQCIIATFETLIELVTSCAFKQPNKKKTGDSRLNGQRHQDLCKFCGQPSELLYFIEQGTYVDIESDPDYKARLSSRYCSEHRPKHLDGTWNPKYLQARRTHDRFELELLRLIKQSATPATIRPHSNDIATNLYIYNYVARQTILPSDENELRQQAREIVDKKFSDRKKQIVMLIASGYKQADIARRLGISRQAVSKTIAKIPNEFKINQLNN